ncbi:MAG: RelA/SpoT family protein, partial [Oscillospiraceae bacterium]|nr:RelA/SpoT family protein [Oscillospiraceae bacterium]
MGFESIKNQISSLNRTFDIDMIERAYRFAEECHNDQVRYTGESFIEHPTSVAMILLEMGLDSETIAAALLHDVVEDTDITLGDIEKNFGKEITNLVDGATKLGRVPYSSQEEEQAENIRKLLLAMSEDIRVMLIKLCDRLHNMRTASGWDEQTQRDKSLETMEVFAPIAHRLGMNNIKEELEDLSLKYLDPFGYSEIEKILNEKHNSEDFIEGITECILVRLNEIGLINPLIEYRIKSRYGIYRKLYIQNRSLEEIYDIYALRIILENSNDCYNALGIVHDMYRSIPNRFKDYISTPKPNGYKSLQSTVVDAKGVAFEVQIRTREMHYEAEYGIAAHWKYKLGIKTDDSLEKRLAWVRQLLEAQRDAEDATDILSNIKSDLLPEEVYVFTPKGDVINLPAGSCVIDFAYAIHTAVGNRMMGAKVGGRIVPITYKVKTGEFIEILTGPADKGPSRDWLNIVHTSGAKS